ncbi:MAG TPA: hypothetical protein VKS79_10670 [Gemmataceae bacterium]|nr:hypothetical protein [Gemmataceae bacterium]
MDPVKRVRDYLLDNVGHMTYPGRPSFVPDSKRWFVPILCRTDRGVKVVGDVELDQQGHIVFAPSREEMLARLSAETPVAS